MDEKAAPSSSSSSTAAEAAAEAAAEPAAAPAVNSESEEKAAIPAATTSKAWVVSTYCELSSQPHGMYTACFDNEGIKIIRETMGHFSEIYKGLGIYDIKDSVPVLL